MLDAPPSLRDASARGAGAPEAWVRCCRCTAEVARLADRVSVGEGELHTFVNPAGEVFELVCFAAAAGALAHGQASREFTWFPGYAWSFARCRGCAAQLGWRYVGPSVFWGLARRALSWP